MTDIRRPSNLNLERRTTNPPDSPTTTTLAGTTAARRAATVLDASEVTDVVTTVVRNRTNREDTPGLPPVTPPPVRLDSSNLAGAGSFSTQLESIARSSINDSEAMTAEFLKLQMADQSFGARMESNFNEARANLREAARILYDRLKPELNQIGSLENQAEQREEQAHQLIYGPPAGEQALSGGEGGEGGGFATLVDGAQSTTTAPPPDIDALYADAWQRTIAALPGMIEQAVILSDQSLAHSRAGNTADAAAAASAAQQLEEQVSEILRSAGFPVNEAAVRELESLVRQNQASGTQRNVLAQYLENHPEIIRNMFPDVDPSRYTGEQLLQMVVEQRVANFDGGMDEVEGLMAATSQLDGNLQAQLQSQAIASHPNALAAAELMVEAHELWTRAQQIQSAHDDAKQAWEGRAGWEAREGVAYRNAFHTAETMRAFTAVASGERPDRDALFDALAQPARNTPTVAQLVREAVDAREASNHSLARNTRY